MSPARTPLDQVVEGIALLSRELNFTGRMLYEGLERPMQALRSGRAPRALGLALTLEELEPLRRTCFEILDEFRQNLAELSAYHAELGGSALGEPLQMAEGEYRYWRTFAERAQILLKKLTLIADLEKLSPLGRNPLQDAWEEVRALAMSGVKTE